MTAREEKIALLLSADAPPARDLAFEIAVAQRIEQRRFIRGLARTFAAGLASVAIIALLMPFLSAFWRLYFTGGSSTVVIAGLLTAVAVLALQPRLQRG